MIISKFYVYLVQQYLWIMKAWIVAWLNINIGLWYKMARVKPISCKIILGPNTLIYDGPTNYTRKWQPCEYHHLKVTKIHEVCLHSLA